MKDKKANRPNDGTELEADAGCYYLDGDLCFSFLTSEGMAKVTVVSSALPNDLSKSVLSLYPFSMQIGYRPGYYCIIVETARDRYYVGELIIEE